MPSRARSPVGGTALASRSGGTPGERRVPYLQVGELWAVVVLYVLLMVVVIPSR